MMSDHETYEEKLKAAREAFEFQVELCKTLGFPSPRGSGMTGKGTFYAVYWPAGGEGRAVSFETSASSVHPRWFRREARSQWYVSTVTEAEQLKWLMGGE